MTGHHLEEEDKLDKPFTYIVYPGINEPSYVVITSAVTDYPRGSQIKCQVLHSRHTGNRFARSITIE